jgi:hypothetical protein
MPNFGKLTQYGASQIMNFMLGGVPMNVPTTWFAAYTVGPSSPVAIGAEPGGNGYQRKEVSNTSGTGGEWTTPSTQVVNNINDIVWDAATGNHGTAQSIALYDSPNNGNAWFYFPLQQPKLIEAGDAMRVPAGALSLEFLPDLFSNLIKNQLLAWILGGNAMNTIPTLYFGYTTSSCSPTAAGTEPSGNGYQRVSVVNNTGNFAPSATGDKTNNVAITFPEATGNQGTAVNVAIWSAATGGTYIGYASHPNRTFGAASTPQISSGDLDLSLLL